MLIRDLLSLSGVGIERFFEVSVVVQTGIQCVQTVAYRFKRAWK